MSFLSINLLGNLKNFMTRFDPLLKFLLLGKLLNFLLKFFNVSDKTQLLGCKF